MSSLTIFGTHPFPNCFQLQTVTVFLFDTFLIFVRIRLFSRALCVVWTTPLVATLGMSLTIPLAMVADMLIHSRHYSAIYILGSAQVNSTDEDNVGILDFCKKTLLLSFYCIFMMVKCRCLLDL